jgi:hypothetical protein
MRHIIVLSNRLEKEKRAFESALTGILIFPAAEGAGFCFNEDAVAEMADYRPAAYRALRFSKIIPVDKLSVFVVLVI